MLRLPDAIDSALYAAAPSMQASDPLEVVGRGGLLRGIARIAVSAGWAAAGLAHGLCLVCAGAAAVGALCRRLSRPAPRPLRRAFLSAISAACCGTSGNCYWIRDTMMQLRRHAPPGADAAAARIQPGAGALLRLLRTGRRAGAQRHRQHAAGAGRCARSVGALELAAARITSVPWDQLGYSQVDNALVNQLAPWTGVYGISFLLVAVNALLAGGILLGRALRSRLGRGWQAWAFCSSAGYWRHLCYAAPARAYRNRRACAAQPGCCRRQATGQGPANGISHIADFTRLAGEQCKTYIAGIPQTGAPTGEIICPPYPTHPDLVAWPESPAPFFEGEPAFSRPWRQLRTPAGAAGGCGVGVDYPRRGAWQ